MSDKPYTTHHEACNRNCKGEINEEPSKTIEGEAIDIKKLLKQHGAGIPVGDEEGAIYLDSPIETIDHMNRRSIDLVDIERHQESILDRYEHLEEIRKQKLEEKSDEEKKYDTSTDKSKTDESKSDTETTEE